MATKLVAVTFDAADPFALGAWWRETLQWEFAPADPEDCLIVDPDGDDWTPHLLFLPSTDKKRTKNRVHLDLASYSDAEQIEIVEALIARGATRVDVGQRDAPWIVLADPEGNEFCVLEPRERYMGAGRLASIVVAAEDPLAAAEFWEHATGRQIIYRSDVAYGLHTPTDRIPDLDVVIDATPKTAKLRVHFDVAPIDGSTIDAEAQRLRALGATDIDIGQHDDPHTCWVVLAAPSGDEFCVVPSG